MQLPRFYVRFSSPFGPMAIVWEVIAGRFQVQRIVLPPPGMAGDKPPRQSLLGAVIRSRPEAEALAGQLERFLQGEAVQFDLSVLALERCSNFQHRVLLAEHSIPRGWVSTYGRIARHLGIPRGARAVGQALATNPFPLAIPCHRAIRADGTLGGYQGGTEMKGALLEMEGVKVSANGRVQTDRFYYSHL